METNIVLARVQSMQADLEPTTTREDPVPVHGELDLECLYRQHSDFVWRNARRLGCDDDLADDVVHEVFLVAARRAHEFRHEANVRTWLFAILYRAVQRLKRDRARRNARVQQYSVEHVLRSATESHSPVEAADYLHYLLAQLDETKRVVFILAELEGMTSVEIAALLGAKPPTIDSRLRAARGALDRLIERESARERRQQP
jgi:RNA polymerase sigma-70 factor (ECF subfamily)